MENSHSTCHIAWQEQCYPDTYTCCLFAQDDFFAAYLFTSSKKLPSYWDLFSINHNLKLVMEKLHKIGNLSLNVQKFIAKNFY